jgi:hypothetical protein
LLLLLLLLLCAQDELKTTSKQLADVKAQLGAAKAMVRHGLFRAGERLLEVDYRRWPVLAHLNSRV